MSEHLHFSNFSERFGDDLKQSGYSESIRKEYGYITADLTEYATQHAQESYTVDFAQNLLSEIHPVEIGLHPIQWTNKQKSARRAVKLMNVFAINGSTAFVHPSTTSGLECP